MSDPLYPTPPDPELLQWTEAYCNGIVSDEQFHCLQERLRQDASARAFYLRYLNLHSALPDYGDQVAQVWNSSEPEAIPSQGRSRWFRIVAVCLCAGIVMMVVGLLLLKSPTHGEPPRVIARLTQIQGSALITDTNTQTRRAEEGAPVYAGSTIRTEGDAGSVVLVYPDGTRVSLVGRTSITCRDEGQKSVLLHGGILFGSVAPQPNGKPMLVVTPKDRLQVLGTRFSLTATSRTTEVRVEEGRVRLTRLRDGKSVEVPAGQRVISDAQSGLAPEDILSAPGEWSEDFEQGLPEGWTGRHVADHLPQGSKGGAQAVRRPGEDRVYFQIVSPAKWANGLFLAHEDSHLHFTFRMQKPGLINVFLLTRTGADPPEFSSNYLFDAGGWWSPTPGEWQTVTIPLAKFRRLSSGAVPIQQVIPFQLLFSSPETDRGLVIDRAWVTRGGPNVVKTRRVK